MNLLKMNYQIIGYGGNYLIIVKWKKKLNNNLDGLSWFKKLKIRFENLDAKHCILLYGLDNF